MAGPPRVLVIDDEQVVRESVSKILAREGLACALACNAAEALDALEVQRFDLVITDLMMPGMDGIALLREFRERRLEAPVIMITGYATMRTAVEAVQLGAFDYVAKPFTRKELGGAIQRALRSRTAEPSGEPRTAEGRQDSARSGALCTIAVGTLFVLRDHGWARFEQDGQVTVGLEQAFARAVGQLVAVELPRPGDALDQGHVCARMRADDGREHLVWAPVTGRVTEPNPLVATEPQLVSHDSCGQGWLFKMIPSALLEEIVSLIVVPPP
jgi:DNA-binding response OmpR family regulator